jgi:hypothetical protein
MNAASIPALVVSFRCLARFVDNLVARQFHLLDRKIDSSIPASEKYVISIGLARSAVRQSLIELGKSLLAHALIRFGLATVRAR